MNTWYKVKVKYTKQLEDGRLKRVTEPYIIDSVSFTDAEARIHETIGQYVQGEFLISGISKVDFADIFYYEDSDEWYQCKISYVSVDADEGKEKKLKSNILITANNVKDAYERLQESLKDMTVSFDVPSITRTPIVDVIPYDPSASDVPEHSEEQVNTDYNEALSSSEEDEKSIADETTENNDVVFEDETE